VVILGDLNAYARETPITTLEAEGYVNTVAAFEGLELNSYRFSGEIGTLDYALANESLFEQVTGATSWTINSDEQFIFDYNEDSTFGAPVLRPDDQGLFDPDSPAKSSDHDPIIIGLDLQPNDPVSVETQQVIVWAAGEDYFGDPQFDLFVNGMALANDVTIPSEPGRLPSAGRDALTRPYVFEIDADIDIESVGVAFTNDRWGGTRDTDRNLYVSHVEFGGETYTPQEHGDFTPAFRPDARKEMIAENSGMVFGNGTLEFAARQVITVYASGENYLGNPKFDLSVNGETIAQGVEVISGTGRLPFDEREALADAFRFKVDADLEIETVGVTFFNDAYAGERNLDRNLFIPKIAIDGAELRPEDNAVFFKEAGENPMLQEAAEGDGHLFANGTLLFDADALLTS
jgi:hypothetical protein